MLPHANLLYLYVRLVSIAVIVYFDSFLAYVKLRLTDRKAIWRLGKERIVFNNLRTHRILFLLTDFWRHSLIIYETPVASVLCSTSEILSPAT